MLGSRLGPYEIAAQIGQGGMGEVYRALDTNLGRQVAIKILPDTFAHDRERLARFEREAKALASLNHPNIAHIYGFEKANGVPALIMELVDGPTLADRIAGGRIPVDEALLIANQTAEAIETAHEVGIIHRDLKPANVNVRPDGTVKVLDLGLAKAIESPLPHDQECRDERHTSVHHRHRAELARGTEAPRADKLIVARWLLPTHVSVLRFTRCSRPGYFYTPGSKSGQIGIYR
jgi:serine/threonine protein kinase